MKIFKITTAYPLYLNKFYAKHPELTIKSYAEQKASLDYDAFSWPDFWSNALTPLGYEMMEVTANIQSMQTAWAKENGVKFKKHNWIQNIAFEQVKKFQPTVLFVQDYVTFSSQWLRELKQSCSSIKLILCWVGSAIPKTDLFKNVDLLLSCAPESIEYFRRVGFRAEHLNHAFDFRINSRLESKCEKFDFSFIGQIIPQDQFHLKRQELLEEILELTPVDIFSPSADLNWRDRLNYGLKQGIVIATKGLKNMRISDSTLSRIPVISKAAKWNEVPSYSAINNPIKFYLKPSVFGLEMYQTLLESKATLNIHADSSPIYASNMRLFEATGVGTCLVTDWKKNISELFEPDKEVVIYKSAEECIDKVKWLLDRPQERKAIAKAGQDRTLKDHTFAQRAVQFDEIIKKELEVR
ncbi:glycosyltransferase [Oscillatoria sp. HE19RPO]|uniref:CgeB family protein n=1 Tax=Oscillatoria sp. HE19RPO TaxID=2954806 RepID=UPI0020C2C158|nr:glycosyltransferase [Oscillatoria sp. HE19RPO]